MSLSDVLTILGLIAAIIAFVSEKNREYLFLKFSLFDIILFISGFLFINYLIAFDWFKDKGLVFETLVLAGWPVASVWAYFFTLFILGYLFYRTYFGFFPLRNRTRVISYYRSQIIKGEFSFLVSLIEKFHKDDISEFLRRVATIKVEEELPLFGKDKFSEAYNNLINSNRLIYANNVYYEIVTDEVFIDNTVNTNPYFFTDFISQLSSNQLCDEKFVYNYLSILIENNNYHLIRELRNNQNFSQHTRYALPDENRILRSLFFNIRVADLNHAWQPYGKLTCKYLEEEVENKFSPLREKYKDEEKELWPLRIHQSIWFFDIMLREAIAQNVQSHMWLFYFHHFMEGLIDNIPDEHGDLDETPMPTNNHYFIHEIFSVMTNWIRLMREMNLDNQMHSTCDCIGQCLYLISKETKLTDKFVTYCFDTVLREYFHLSEHEETDAKLTQMEEFLLNPVMGFNTPRNATEKAYYVEQMNLAWAEFDKVPYQGHEDNGAIQRFIDNVITPINI